MRAVPAESCGFNTSWYANCIGAFCDGFVLADHHPSSSGTEVRPLIG